MHIYLILLHPSLDLAPYYYVSLGELYQTLPAIKPTIDLRRGSLYKRVKITLDSFTRVSMSHRSQLRAKPTFISADIEDDEGPGSTIARCRKCNAQVAECFNSWIRLTSSYSLPSLLGSYSITGLQKKGHPIAASSGTELSGW